MARENRARICKRAMKSAESRLGDFRSRVVCIAVGGAGAAEFCRCEGVCRSAVWENVVC